MNNTEVVEFEILCDFGNQKTNVTFYIGLPKNDNHPIKFQSSWLSDNKGGRVPDDVIKSITDLRELSIKNGLNFQQLCLYAFVSATKDKTGINRNGFTRNRIAEDVKKYAEEFTEKKGNVEIKKEEEKEKTEENVNPKEEYLINENTAQQKTEDDKTTNQVQKVNIITEVENKKTTNNEIDINLKIEKTENNKEEKTPSEKQNTENNSIYGEDEDLI